MPIRGLITILYSPAETLEGLSAAPRPWLLPLVASILAAVLMNVMVIERIGMPTLIRNQLEESKMGEQLGPEGIQRVVDQAAESPFQKVMSYVSAVFGVPLFLAAIAGVAYGLLIGTGAQTKYPAVVAAWCWSLWPVLLVKVVGSAAFLLMVHDYTGVDAQNLVMSSVGAFLSKETFSPPVRALASGIDALGFWSVFLQTLGLQTFSQQVSLRQALWVSVVIYVCGVLIHTGWAVIFG